MNLIKLYLLPSFSVLKETKPDSAAATAVVQLELLFDAFYKNQVTILEYLSENYIIALDEESKIRQRARLHSLIMTGEGRMALT